MKKAIFSIISIALFALLSTAAFAQKSVAGEWDASFNTPGGVRTFKLILQVDGEKLSGTAKRSNGDVPVTGTIKGEDISFEYTVEYNGHALSLFFSGKVKGDSMSGTVSFGGQAEDAWSATRSKSEEPKGKP
jgi:hypothetical protein